MAVTIDIGPLGVTTVEVHGARRELQADSLWSLVRLVRGEWGDALRVTGLTASWMRLGKCRTAHLHSWDLDGVLCGATSYRADVWPASPTLRRCARCLELADVLDEGVIRKAEPTELAACVTETGRAEHLCRPGSTVSLCNFVVDAPDGRKLTGRCHLCERIAEARSGGRYEVTGSRLESREGAPA